MKASTEWLCHEFAAGAFHFLFYANNPSSGIENEAENSSFVGWLTGTYVGFCWENKSGGALLLLVLGVFFRSDFTKKDAIACAPFMDTLQLISARCFSCRSIRFLPLIIFMDFRLRELRSSGLVCRRVYSFLKRIFFWGDKGEPACGIARDGPAQLQGWIRFFAAF